MLADELERQHNKSGSVSHRSTVKNKNAQLIKSKKKAEIIKKNEEKKERDSIAAKIRRNINIKVTSQILGYKRN